MNISYDTVSSTQSGRSVYLTKMSVNLVQDMMDENSNWQWCLLTIAGNKTIVQRRRKDFIHYLRMNTAR